MELVPAVIATMRCEMVNLVVDGALKFAQEICLMVGMVLSRKKTKSFRIHMGRSETF